MGRNFQDNLHAMLTWFLSPKSKGLELDGQHAVQMLAHNISLGYERIGNFEPIAHNSSVSINEIDEEEYLDKDPDYLAPVLGLRAFVQQEIKEYLIDFLVHGSLATLDYAKGWSDFDTYLIIKKETVFDPSALVSLRGKLLDAYHFLHDIDIFQHHGFLICTELDLDNYPPLFMPLQVLELSKSLIGNQTISFKVIDTTDLEIRGFFKRVQFYEQVTTTGVLKHHAYDGEYLLSDYRNAENGMYQFKYLLNNVVITPSYYFGALGDHSYKRDAIEKIKQSLSKQSLETLDMVTYIRSEWHNREVFPTKGNQIPQWVQEVVGNEYFRVVHEFMKEVGHFLEKRVNL